MNLDRPYAPVAPSARVAHVPYAVTRDANRRPRTPKATQLVTISLRL